MFRLMHEMRVRIITVAAFTGDKVIAAILFERTMDGEVEGQAGPAYPVGKARRRAVPKVDKGLAEKDGVQLMKPMPDLDALLDARREAWHLRHQDALGDQPAVEAGIAAIVAQQFEVGDQISAHGLIPDHRAGGLDQEP